MGRVPTPEEVAAWPAPNYVNPITRRPLVLGVDIPLIFLVALVVSARFYSRTVIIRALGTDDWFMLAAGVFAIATYIMNCVSTQNEFQTGYHIFVGDLRPDILEDPVQTAQIAMSTQLNFVVITAFMKTSVLLTYLRIFISRQNKWFCYIMLSFTTVWALTSFFIALFQCTPVQSYWYIAEYPDRECIDVAPIYYVTGVLNIASDFLIFLWPARDLAKIHISFRQRVTLIIMFSLGVLICVAGVCRIWWTSIYMESYDTLWNGSTLYVIIAIETSFGICCGSLPACKPIMSKAFPRVFASTQHTSYPLSRKKPSKLDGQNFPFETITGGIIKEETYSVEYEAAQPQRNLSLHTVTTHIRAASKDDGLESPSSEDGIMGHKLIGEV
ncbi:hypothetical protein BS50DRAFT_584806 [Corynespora cassiicola Philippines]|uniref:Rhodopsin domain-containing protein n=1 Tax=Corynespora cassiicola Philippines TaxID=1448308 RepID=A0A2T2P0T7_CORCC|nr:hypothetical protein BS50DRAFT_584806 [Corynespora cassiicola Philippines]